MSEQQHTPGPWTVGTAHEDPQFQSILDARGRCLADIGFHTESDSHYPLRAESEANACLMAAAPEMRALIARAVSVLQRCTPDGLSDHDALTEFNDIFDGPEYRAVIAKATQVQP